MSKLSTNSKRRINLIERDRLSDTYVNVNGVDLTDPELWDTADSINTKRTKVVSCEEWKQQFDSTVNFHLNEILQKIKNNRFEPEELAHIRTLTKDDAFVHMIQLTGREEYLQRVLLSVFEVGAERCLEHVFDNYYTQHVFQLAYRDFMDLTKEMGVEDACYTISLQILLRLVKDNLYGEFTMFGLKRR
jgi:hypothetical protein